MSYENTSCPCGGKKERETMICADCVDYIESTTAHTDLARHTNHAHGDAIIDNLRIARGRLARSLKTLQKCTQTAVENEPRYDYGRYLDGVVDDLADGGIDNMYWGWFSRRAEHVMECVVDAEAEPEEDCPSPEKETWADFRALSAALREHAEALKQLASAEKMAAPAPVNVQGQTTPTAPKP